MTYVPDENIVDVRVHDSAVYCAHCDAKIVELTQAGSKSVARHITEHVRNCDKNPQLTKE